MLDSVPTFAIQLTIYGMKHQRAAVQKSQATRQGVSHPSVGKKPACVLIVSHQHATAAPMISPRHANALDGALVIPD